MRALERRLLKLEKAARPPDNGVVMVIVMAGDTEAKVRARIERETPGALAKARVTYVLNFGGAA